jgi:hypothetical protein
MRPFKLAGLSVIALLLAAAACDEEGPLEELTGCGTARPATSDPTGTWYLQGDGERTGCDDSSHDGSFSFETRQGFFVNLVGNELELADPGAVPITLLGHVYGDCIEFQLYEGDPSTALTYKGSLSPSGSLITGEFYNDDNEGCVETGDFTVDVDK